MTDYLCPTCGPITEDDGLLTGPGDAVCCAFCGCVEEEMTPLAEAYAAVCADRDKAHADIAEMVKKAADKNLDGYRELGNRAAKAENERDELAARCERLQDAAEKVRHWHDARNGGMVVSDQSVRDLWAVLSETPAVSLAHVRAEAIKAFKEELLKSVKAVFRPHIEGVYAVIEKRIRHSASQSGGEPTKADASIDDDKACVLNVLMNDPEKGWGVVSSGLEQDFKAGMNVFNVRFKDGSEHRISFKIEEL